MAKLRLSIRLALVALVMLVALGGGVSATLAYDHFVALPTDVVPPRDLSAIVPPDHEVPPSEPAAERPIDPLRQAIESVRPGLGPDALLELRARRDGDVVHLEGRAHSRGAIARVAAAVGTIGGIVAVDTRGVEVTPRLHVVEPGEHLHRIARRYYGHGSAWRRIVAYTPGLEGRTLRPGDAVLIPPLDE